jgi:conjugative transfer pilus assembly protein TraH
MKKLVALILFLSFVFSPVVKDVVYAAGFVDEWLDQQTVTGPDHFEGQKRGYYTLGSFSGRINNTVDYPVSITLPRLKAGCGGIDMFMGGFSFLNFDMLVQKLQKTLQAAPFVAFDIALNTLCKDCANAIKSAEQIANALNSLQLDSCKASKALVAYSAESLGVGNSEQQAKLHEMHANFLQESGIKPLYSAIDSAINSKRGEADKIPEVNISEMLKGCPREIKDLLIPSIPDTPVSVLEVAGLKSGLSSDFIDVVRGVLGDVIIRHSEKMYSAELVPPCTNQNQVDIMEDFFTKKNILKKDKSGNCSPDNGINNDLVNYVHLKISSIANKMQNKIPFSSDEKAFISSSPLPIASAIKGSMLSFQGDSTSFMMSEIIARAYFIKMFSDLSSRVLSLMDIINSAGQKNAGAVSGEERYACSVELLNTPMDKLQILEKKTRDAVKLVNAEYIKLAEQQKNLMQFIGLLKSVEDQAKRDMVKQLGSPLKLGPR